jgi:hypothetical protein
MTDTATTAAASPSVGVRIRGIVLGLSLVLSLALPLWIVLAALGTKFGLWSWVVGFGQMTFMTVPPWTLGALALALVALVLTVAVRPRAGWGKALLALAIPAIALGMLVSLRGTATSLPPIHDISTDPSDPPEFSATVLAVRAAVVRSNPVLPPTENRTAFDAANVTPFSGRSFADLQREAYPDIAPAVVALPPAEAFGKAVATATVLGWHVQPGLDPAAGRFEAVATSFWFGFKDDIVVTVRPDGAGSRIDARSVSRVGVSDLGANARRLRAFLAAVKT